MKNTKLIETLENCLIGNHRCVPVMITTRRNDDAVLYRPIITEDDEDEKRGAAMQVPYMRDIYWEPIARVSRAIKPLSDKLDLIAEFQPLRSTLLYFQTLFACRWASRLAERFCVDTSFHLDSKDVRHACKAYLQCLGEYRCAMEFVNETSSTIVSSLLTPPSGSMHRSPTLIIEPRGELADAVWLSSDGRESTRESLPQLFSRVVAQLQSRMEDRLRRTAGRVERHGAYIRRELEKTCPEVAKAVEIAVHSGRGVAYWLFSGECSHRMGFEVFLLVDPLSGSKSNGAVSLFANRANAEFILENSKRQLFYFPPTRLSCRIAFEPTEQLWRVCRPEIRIPEGSLTMVHPYTGPMARDEFACFETLKGAPTKAMFAISEEARGAIKTPWCWATHAEARDLCMPAQDSSIAELIGVASEDMDELGQPDPRTIVEGIWMLARLGLQKGHLENMDTPRARLDLEQQLYPIECDTVAGTSLSSRVFRFSC